MKVKELIKKLKEFPPNDKLSLEVYVQDMLPIDITFDDIVFNPVDCEITEVTICVEKCNCFCIECSDKDN
jgi:hypothetical protein